MAGVLIACGVARRPRRRVGAGLPRHRDLAAGARRPGRAAPACAAPSPPGPARMRAGRRAGPRRRTRPPRARRARRRARGARAAAERSRPAPAPPSRRRPRRDAPSPARAGPGRTPGLGGGPAPGPGAAAPAPRRPGASLRTCPSPVPPSCTCARSTRATARRSPPSSAGLSGESRSRRFLGPKPRADGAGRSRTSRTSTASPTAPSPRSIRPPARSWARRATRRGRAATRWPTSRSPSPTSSSAAASGPPSPPRRWRRRAPTACDTLTASTLWENVPARALLRRLGFRPTGSGDGVVELELDLAADPARPRRRAWRGRRSVVAGRGGGRRLTGPGLWEARAGGPVPDALRPGPRRTAGHLAVALRRSTALRRRRWAICAHARSWPASSWAARAGCCSA